MMTAGWFESLIALDCSTVSMVFSPGKPSSESPASRRRFICGSKHSRWRRKTSVTSAAMGLSRKTGMLGIRLARCNRPRK